MLTIKFAAAIDMRSFKSAIYLSALIIGCVLVVFAIYVFPLPGTDSRVFMPPALSFAHHKGFTNPLYYVASFTDPTHADRFNYYVPVYPLVLGWLSRIKPDIRTIFFFCSLFSIAGLLLYARTIISFLPNITSKPLQWAILLSFAFLGTYLLPTVSRPENFTCLFVLLVYTVYRFRERIHPVAYFAAMAVLFSLLLATQLIGFFFCFLFYVLYEVLDSRHIGKTVLRNALLLLVIIGLFCAILELGPIGLKETYFAIMWHVGLALNRTDHGLKLMLYYWLYAPLSFGFLAIFLLAALFFFKEMGAKARGAGAVKILLCLPVAFLILLGFKRYVLAGAPTVYNVTQFILPLTAYIIFNVIALRPSMLKQGTTAVLLVTCIAGSLLMLRHGLLFCNVLYTGKDFASARALVKKYTVNNKKVMVSNGIWPVFEQIDHPKISILEKIVPGDTILFQQAYFPYPEDVVKTWNVICDWRSAEPVTFLGIKLANHPHGYGFILYVAK